MLKLSRKTLLALEAVIDIAFNARPEPVQAKEITARQGVPQRYLEQVLQQLVRCGILKGVRGPRGGYRLARERRRVTVGEVIRVLEGGEDQALDVPAESGSPLGARVLNPFWERISHELMARLDAVTIDDICRDAEEQAIESESRGTYDYAI